MKTYVAMLYGQGGQAVDVALGTNSQSVQDAILKEIGAL